MQPTGEWTTRENTSRISMKMSSDLRVNICGRRAFRHSPVKQFAPIRRDCATRRRVQRRAAEPHKLQTLSTSQAINDKMHLPPRGGVSPSEEFIYLLLMLCCEREREYSVCWRARHFINEEWHFEDNFIARASRATARLRECTMRPPRVSATEAHHSSPRAAILIYAA